jgi:hypothetical protein
MPKETSPSGGFRREEMQFLSIVSGWHKVNVMKRNLEHL